MLTKVIGLCLLYHCNFQNKSFKYSYFLLHNNKFNLFMTIQIVIIIHHKYCFILLCLTIINHKDVATKCVLVFSKSLIYQKSLKHIISVLNGNFNMTLTMIKPVLKKEKSIFFIFEKGNKVCIYKFCFQTYAQKGNQ